jgi:hypothetical protein
MSLVIPHRPIPRVALGERIAIDRRAISQPAEITADLMAVRLPAADRQRPPLEPAQVRAQRLRPSLVDRAILVRLG